VPNSAVQLHPLHQAGRTDKPSTVIDRPSIHPLQPLHFQPINLPLHSHQLNHWSLNPRKSCSPESPTPTSHPSPQPPNHQPTPHLALSKAPDFPLPLPLATPTPTPTTPHRKNEGRLATAAPFDPHRQPDDPTPPPPPPPAPAAVPRGRRGPSRHHAEPAAAGGSRGAVLCSARVVPAAWRRGGVARSGAKERSGRKREHGYGGGRG